MRKTMPGFKKILVITGFVLGAGLIILLISWNPAAEYLIKKELTRLEGKWNGKIRVDNLEVSWLTIRMDNLFLSGNDTLHQPLFTARHLEVAVSPWQIFSGSRIPSVLVLDSAQVHLYQNENGFWNFSRKAAKIAEENPDTTVVSFPKGVRQLEWTLNRMLNGNLPDVSVSRLSLSVKLGADSLVIDSLNLTSGSEKLDFHLSGPVGSLTLAGRLSSDSLLFWYPRPFRLTFPVSPQSPLSLASDTGSFTVSKSDDRHFLLKGRYKKFEILTSGLADGPVLFDSLAGNSSLVFSEPDPRVTVFTRLKLNQFSIEDSLTYLETDAFPEVTTQVSVPPVESGVVTRSLPATFLGPLNGMSWKGRLGYKLTFSCDFNRIDSLKLSGEVVKDKFSLVSPGVSFGKLDSVFYQPVYDGLEIKREVLIGPANPEFTRFEGIPNFLVRAVLTSEDGSFLFHRGFNEEAMQGALIENIKTRKFRRGASTISMQFVKNVYLNRKKTLARKFQELMITWLLENNRPVSKERMLEIYFNMIEWGPNVYGIGEAAGFYFKKKPSQLTLEESLFLAALIPSPKRFYRRFDGESLKPSLIETMTFVAKKMEAYQHIPDGTAAGLTWNLLKMTGAAKSYLTPQVQDSTLQNPSAEEEEND